MKRPRWWRRDHHKLAGIQSGATRNSSDSELGERSRHTGTQLPSTIHGLDDHVMRLVDRRLDQLRDQGYFEEGR